MIFYTGNEIFWEIREVENGLLKKIYKEDHNDEPNYIFGLTYLPKHIIYLNKNMVYTQKIQTLKHELAHCYLWSFGFGNIEEFTEEMLCDIIAASNEFINSIIEEYTDETKKKA